MVDLRTCKPGASLKTANGLILKYVGPLPPGHFYDHEVKYPDGMIGTRTHDGYVYRTNRMPAIDEDIIEVLPRMKRYVDAKGKVRYRREPR